MEKKRFFHIIGKLLEQRIRGPRKTLVMPEFDEMFFWNDCFFFEDALTRIKKLYMREILLFSIFFFLFKSVKKLLNWKFFEDFFEEWKIQFKNNVLSFWSKHSVQSILIEYLRARFSNFNWDFIQQYHGPCRSRQFWTVTKTKSSNKKS